MLVRKLSPIALLLFVCTACCAEQDDDDDGAMKPDKKMEPFFSADRRIKASRVRMMVIWFSHSLSLWAPLMLSRFRLR